MRLLVTLALLEELGKEGVRIRRVRECKIGDVHIIKYEVRLILWESKNRMLKSKMSRFNNAMS